MSDSCGCGFKGRGGGRVMLWPGVERVVSE